MLLDADEETLAPTSINVRVRLLNMGALQKSSIVCTAS